MSRIEEALEKAARFRNNREPEIQEKPAAVQTRRKAAPVISYPRIGSAGTWSRLA
jgi:hypothetical protein